MCKKKKYRSAWEAKKALGKIIGTSKKHPERNEISVYQCPDCNQYHLSSKNSDYVPTKFRGKSYFEIQKEKWGNFLQKYSKNKPTF